MKGKDRAEAQPLWAALSESRSTGTPVRSATTMVTTGGPRRRLPRGADPLGLRAHPAGPPRQPDQPGAQAVEAGAPQASLRHKPGTVFGIGIFAAAEQLARSDDGEGAKGPTPGMPP